MRWYEISDEKRVLMMERYRRGDSFSQIGRDMHIDRRVVARIVREDGEKQSGRAAIRRDELARLFHEHREAMEKVAKVLLELTASPSLRDSLSPGDPDIDSALASRLPAEFALKYALPPETPGGEAVDTELKQRVELRLGQRRGKAAFEGLKEHIPALEAAIRNWRQAAIDYQEGWDQLKAPAASYGVPPDVAECGLKLALQRIPTFTQEDVLPRFREPGPAPEAPERFARLWLQNTSHRRLLQGFSQRLEQLNAAYDKIEEILGPPRLDNALVAGHCQYCPIP